MKMKGAKAVHYDSGPNMTPLVDVVMVILIFLMLAGSFGAASHFLPNNMPITTKGKGKVTDVVITEVPKITVSVIPFEGSFKATSPDLRDEKNQIMALTTQEALLNALNAMRIKKQNSGTKAEDMQIIIAPSKTLKFQHVMSVYEAAMVAEWPKIGFAAP
ncbi:MAG TPA: biopolymer transporter ExbD [Tepidisphaeraceae bacterium]|nr:biopolymer transporter ExbD [Tepidisphaeraceae bacterium]